MRVVLANRCYSSQTDISGLCKRNEETACTGHSDCADGRVGRYELSVTRSRSEHTEITMASTAGISSTLQGVSEEEALSRMRNTASCTEHIPV